MTVVGARPTATTRVVMLALAVAVTLISAVSDPAAATWVDLHFNASFSAYMQAEGSPNCKLMSVVVLEHLHENAGLEYQRFPSVVCQPATTPETSNGTSSTDTDAEGNQGAADAPIAIKLNCSDAGVATILGSLTPLCVVFRGVPLCSQSLADLSLSQSGAYGSTPDHSGANGTIAGPENEGGNDNVWQISNSPTSLAILCVAVVLVVAAAVYGGLRMKRSARKRRQVERRASSIPFFGAGSNHGSSTHLQLSRFSRQPSQEFIDIARASVQRGERRVNAHVQSIGPLSEHEPAYDGYSEAAWDDSYSGASDLYSVTDMTTANASAAIEETRVSKGWSVPSSSTFQVDGKDYEYAHNIVGCSKMTTL